MSDSVTPCDEWVNMTRSANWRKSRKEYAEGYAEIVWNKDKDKQDKVSGEEQCTNSEKNTKD